MTCLIITAMTDRVTWVHTTQNSIKLLIIEHLTRFSLLFNCITSRAFGDVHK